MFLRRSKNEILFGEPVNVFALKEEVKSFNKDIQVLELAKELRTLEKEINKAKEVRKYYKDYYWLLRAKGASGKERSAALLRVREVMDLYGLEGKLQRRDELLELIKS